MADVNKCCRKRRSPSLQVDFEVSNADVCPLQSSIIENVEPEAKVARKEELTENGDSNLYPELSQNSVETNVSVQEKIAELQEENMKLRRQLQAASSKVCACSLKLGGQASSQESEPDCHNKPLINIKFHDEDVANAYRNKFQNFLASFVELTHKSDNLEMNIEKSNDVNLVPLLDVTSPDASKKKRKRKKSKSTKQLFVVDTTPSITTKENRDLKYTSKYSVILNDEVDTKQEGVRLRPVQTCFNCDRNHSLRDCPEPKNFVKINIARQKMKSQQVNKTRYHLEEDQKYSHLIPGKVSQKLRAALGVNCNQLPEYIYRMRALGYPPGWIEEAQVMHSDISMYDIEGKDVRCSSKLKQGSIDPEKVIEYAGFNMPLGESVRDDYRVYKCPPYSEKCSKNAMLEFINKMEEKKEDNLESCDMEIDLMPEKNAHPAPPGCEDKIKATVKEATNTLPDRLSPSLTELERKKLELLAALDESNTNGSDETAVNNNETHQKTETKQLSSEGKDTVTVFAMNETKDVSNELKVQHTSELKIQLTNEPERTATTGETEIKVETEIKIETEQSEINQTLVNDKDVQDESDLASTEVNETCIVKEVDGVFTSPQTPVNQVKRSTFGTPVIKSASLFSTLPDADNFSKGVSPVINFENLPNSTGKYEQMSGVLFKVRRTLKHLNEQS